MFFFKIVIFRFSEIQMAAVKNTLLDFNKGFQGYLSGEVLLGGEGLSESTESMLDQVIQLTWVGERGRKKCANKQ